MTERSTHLTIQTHDTDSGPMIVALAPRTAIRERGCVLRRKHDESECDIRDDAWSLYERYPNSLRGHGVVASEAEARAWVEHGTLPVTDDPPLV